MLRLETPQVTTRFLTLRHASSSDLSAVARIYIACFPEALTTLFGHSAINVHLIESLFRTIYEYEPKGFWIVEGQETVAGFTVAISDVRTFGQHWGWYRFLLKSGWRIGTGYYKEISRHALWNLSKMAWRYAATSPPKSTEPCGQIFWLAVHPEFRDSVIGFRLIQRAENYLMSQGKAIRIEINLPKKSLITFYKQRGYRPLGQVEFPWSAAVVMLRSLS